jgi:hypothetical protein
MNNSVCEADAATDTDAVNQRVSVTLPDGAVDTVSVTASDVDAESVHDWWDLDRDRVMVRVLVGGLVTDMVAEPSESVGVPAERDLVGGALSVRALVGVYGT